MRNIRSVIKKVLKEETILKDTLEFFKKAPKVDIDEKGRPEEFILGLWRYGMLEKEVALRMKGWLGMKQNALSDQWLDKDIKDVGGDDSFHDWMSQIISMGKDHYEAALDVDNNYKKYSNVPYEESFAYAIPHYSEIEIPEIFR